MSITMGSQSSITILTASINGQMHRRSTCNIDRLGLSRRGSSLVCTHPGETGGNSKIGTSGIATVLVLV